MRVLVTGASGLIGSAVCDALLARGDDVVGLSRQPDRARGTNPTVRWHAWNPILERPPEESLEGVNGVVNLIGEPIDQRLTLAAKQRITDSRDRATKNLIDGMRSAPAGPRVLVSQSAVGYYGDRGDALIDESTPPGSDFAVEVTKAWEAAARDGERAGLRVAITRTGLVLDPAGGLLKQLLRPFRLGIGGPLAGGRQYMPWIHRDDEVRILLWLLDGREQSGVYNATAPNPVTNREFSKTLGKVLKRPSAVPAPKLAVAALLGREMADIATGGQRAIPRRALDAGFEFRFGKLEPALRDLLGR
jgi:uncharacterized protein (TIGR01777 family)